MSDVTIKLEPAWDFAGWARNCVLVRVTDVYANHSEVMVPILLVPELITALAKIVVRMEDEAVEQSAFQAFEEACEFERKARQLRMRALACGVLISEKGTA